MDRHRTALAIAALSCLAACERAGTPPPRSEAVAALQVDAADRPLRVADSGRGADTPAAGDGLRPAPGPTGLRP